jgi:hypothetical protein
MLDEVDIENLSRGIRPNCKDHLHVGRVRAFDLSRSAHLGKLLAFVSSSATTKDDPAPSGCFIEIGGYVEYTHLRRSTQPRLTSIYAIGEKIAADINKPFLRRRYYPVN